MDVLLLSTKGSCPVWFKQRNSVSLEIVIMPSNMKTKSVLEAEARYWDHNGRSERAMFIRDMIAKGLYAPSLAEIPDWAMLPNQR